jgi:hypothetical protein
MSPIPGVASGVMMRSHLMMPGSAETAAGAATLAGITKETTMNIAAKTPSILGNLIFIFPPELFKPENPFHDTFPDPNLICQEPPAKIFDLLARELFIRIIYLPVVMVLSCLAI